MKRRFLLVLTIVILVSVYFVQAQAAAPTEETILGLSISSLLIAIPLAMIGLGLVFFLGLYFKDHYRNIVSSLKNRLKRRKIREAGKKVTDYPRELENLQKRLPILEPEDALQNLSNLAKRFFAEKINIGYEFTPGELEKELEKVNPSWASFPEKLAHLRYSGEHLSKKEVSELIKEFWSIIRHEKKKRISLTILEKLKKRRIIFEIGILKNLRQYLERAKPAEEEKLTSKDVAKYFVKRQKQGFLNLIGIIKKIKTDAVNEIKAQLGTVNKSVAFFSNKMSERKINSMLDLLAKAQKQIKQGGIEQAKNTYKQAYQLYYKIPVEEQAHIITELQSIQQRIYEYKPPVRIIKETPIDRIKRFFQQNLTVQTINKANNLIREAQKQVSQGRIEHAKNTCKQAYQLYYRLPMEQQEQVLYRLKKIKDEITEIEKEKEKQEIEELSKELNKLKSEEDIYIIFDKGNISKKIGYLSNYIQKVSEQEVHGLKAGKDHLKEKLKDLVQTAEKVEKEEEKKLTYKEKTFLTRLKEFGKFFARKEASIEKTFVQTRKQVFDHIHDITKQAKAKPAEPVKKPLKTKPELKPHMPPAPQPLYAKKIETKDVANIEKILLYLKNKKDQGLFKVKPAGKEFLDKVESITSSIKKSEQKEAAALKQYEKELLDSVTSFMKKDKEKALSNIEEEKRMLEFLEHMKEKEMVSLDEQKLQKEKEKLLQPLIETPKVRMDIERLRKLHEEEQKVMEEIQKIPRIPLKPVQQVHEKQPPKYEWEVTADEIRRKKTRVMTDLLKEEKDIQSKLKGLE